MTEQSKPVAIGFDLETASADKLYTGGHEGPFIRLCGAQGDGAPVIETDAEEFAASLAGADAIYGANIFRFDIPALARHAGADYDELAAKSWDLCVLGRLIDPPGAKHSNEKDYYGLDAMAKRFGHTGKSDDLKALALKWGPHIECEGCCPHGGDTARPTHAETCTRKRFFTVDQMTEIPGAMPKAQRTDLGFERIPVDDPQYRDYLRGDLDATQFVRREVFKRVTNWSYARREMKVSAIQNRMSFNGWRVNRVTLANRVRQEDERRQAAVAILCDEYGLPRTKADGEPSLAPWATKGGRRALEDAFRQAGAPDVPRTKTGEMAIGKDPMGAEYWVNHKGERKRGLLHPDVYGGAPAVVELAGVLANATGATAKYAEIERYVTAEGRVHGGIGDDQASGRWAMTRPSLTNLGKRGEKVQQRAPFVSERGHVLIACDASQVDMRAVAAESQDPAYMALFVPGRDAHMDMAQVYFGERTKDARDKTKAINHGLNYGQGAAAVAARNGLPLALVNAAVAERAQAFPRLVDWTEEIRAQGAAGRLLDNGFGRMMRCDPDRAYTQAPALMGQGAARDIVCEALLRLVARWPVVTAYLRGVVHDEVILSVPEAEAEVWRERLREAFTFTWKDVPILCDVSAPGTNWAACYDGE